MENFKQELEILLAKYPDIGEFTIHIQPRLKIDVPDKGLKIPIVNPPIMPNVTWAATNTDPITSLESAINTRKVAEMEAMIKT